MISYIKNTLTKIGVDRAVIYTIIWRVVSALGGIGSIFFITNYLSGSEQGYFYTFSSLISLQFFFELGFAYLITPFVAHENSLLVWLTKSELNGPEKNISRLSSLLRFTVKWFSILSLFAFITTSTVGYVFFNYYHERNIQVNWLIPYLLLCFVSSASLNTIPILAYFEGLGKIQEVVKIRLLQQVVYLSLLFTFFISGFKLYASPLASIIGFLVVLIYILTADRIAILKNIWYKLNKWTIPYKEEIFPLQWRIAVSLIGSYLMYQLFNPILFAFDGPVAAGQMGLSLAAFTGIFFISFALINTRQPLFSGLAAQNNIRELNRIHRNALLSSTCINFLLNGVLITFVWICNINDVPIAQKFLPILPLTLLSIGMLAINIISGMGAYFRAFKKEPFFLLFIVLAIANSLLCLIFGRLAGAIGITVAFSILAIFLGLTWAIIIFKKEKRQLAKR